MAEAKVQLSALCEAGLQRRQPAGPEHSGDDKVLPGLPWGRVLHQGKPGKSLTASQCYYKSANSEGPGLDGQALKDNSTSRACYFLFKLLIFSI